MADTMSDQTTAPERLAAGCHGSDEERFYSDHDWSLNPVLSLQQLFERLQETLGKMAELPPSWQREECKANLYLLVSAITCTVDDYLGPSPPDLTRASLRFPRLGIPLLAVQKLIHAVDYALSFPGKRRVARWRKRWTSSVDAACSILTAASEPRDEQWEQSSKSIQENITFHFPKSLLDRPMQLPSGLRSQDLTHHDAIALADRFAACPATAPCRPAGSQSGSR